MCQKAAPAFLQMEGAGEYDLIRQVPEGPGPAVHGPADAPVEVGLKGGPKQLAAWKFSKTYKLS